jgi:hypothetical protein
MRRSTIVVAVITGVAAACAHHPSASAAQRAPRTEAEIAALNCARSIAAEHGFPVADGPGALANRRAAARIGFESTADGTTAWGWGILYRTLPPQTQTVTASGRRDMAAWESQQTAGVNMRRQIESKCRYGPAANDPRPKKDGRL